MFELHFKSSQILRACCCIDEIRRTETDLAYREHSTQWDPDLGCCYTVRALSLQVRSLS